MKTPFKTSFEIGDLIADVEVSGKYIPATLEYPSEGPEVNVLELLDSSGEAVDFDTLDQKTQEDIIDKALDAYNTHLENGMNA